MKNPNTTRKEADWEKRIPTLFSLQLRRARNSAVWDGRPVKQKQVAELLGINHSTYWRWENGKAFPDDANITALVDIFDLNSDDIWINTFRIPPDMHDFLTTTQEGSKVIHNIRRIMDTLVEQNKPTTRKGLPNDEQILRSAARLGHRDPRTVASIKKQTDQY